MCSCDLTDTLSAPGEEPWEIATRRAMGHTLTCARRIHLETMTPQDGGHSPASTGYCLFDAGKEYLVYQPEPGRFTLELPDGVYRCAWFDSRTDSFRAAGQFTTSTGFQTFTAPSSHEFVLHVAAGARTETRAAHP